METNTKRKIFSWLLALGLIVGAGYILCLPETQAAKKTKWQAMLERNGVDTALWQRYLPKVTRKEYRKVTKSLRGSNSPAAADALGPEIAVEVWHYDRSEKERYVKIDSNKAYRVSGKDTDGHTFNLDVPANISTKVEYYDNGHLRVYGDSVASTIVDDYDDDDGRDDDKVIFEAADGDNSNIIFDTNNGNYDHYRGKIEVNYWHGKNIYNKSEDTVSQIWVINKLPLEQYVWGMGETTGTGPKNHVRVMTTIFRTYGFWYIENATKYKPLGFTIRSDAGSQIYGGYDWEIKYPNIHEAANETRAHLVTYKGVAALTPYCSYTDGKTRSWKDVWGGNDYPYLKSVKDHKKGKKKGLKQGENGNHMVGLSAHGAIGYADDGKSWTWILKHYYSKVDVKPAY